MNRTNSEYALPSKAAEDRRTPRRYRVGDSRAHFRQVLECAAAAALWISRARSGFQCTASKSWGLSMNRTRNRVESGCFWLENHIVLAGQLLEQPLFGLSDFLLIFLES